MASRVDTPSRHSVGPRKTCLSTVDAVELARVPALRDRWVAIDPKGLRNDRQTPMCLALRSGAVVVDADYELDVLCKRLAALRETSLTIVYAGLR